MAAADHPVAEVQVAPGKYSPIVRAINEAEKGTTGEIRVHLSRKWFDKDPYRSALRVFNRFGMSRTSHRNGVLLYVNLRKKNFAIVGDEAIHGNVGQRYWEELVRHLRADLHSTHFENAIAMAVSTIGITLKKFFPLERGVEHENELSNEVTTD